MLLRLRKPQRAAGLKPTVPGGPLSCCDGGTLGVWWGAGISRAEREAIRLLAQVSGGSPSVFRPTEVSLRLLPGHLFCSRIVLSFNAKTVAETDLSGRNGPQTTALRQMVVSDPYEQELLVRVPEPGVKLAKIINCYDSPNWPDEKVFCAHCQAARHRRGFTVLLSDGFRTLIGRNCGEKLFGEAWKQAHKSFNAELRRRSLWDWCDRAKTHLSAVHTRLRKWYPDLARVEQACHELRNFDPGLYEKLAASGGELINYRFDETQREYVTDRYGFVDGVDVLQSPNIKSQLTDVRMRIREVVVKFSEPGAFAFGDQKLGHLRKRASLRQLSELERKYQDAQKLFNPSQWRAILRWANASADTTNRYSLRGNTITSVRGQFSLPSLGDLAESPRPYIEFVMRGGVEPPPIRWDD